MMIHSLFLVILLVIDVFETSALQVLRSPMQRRVQLRMNSDAVITPANLVTSLEWRYATKAFDTARNDIPADVLAALEESLRLTPSSYGLQPWKFYIISNPEVKASLRPVSYNQAQITDSSHLVVFARKSEMKDEDVNDFVNQMIQERGADPTKLEGYRNMMINSIVKGKDIQGQKDWASRQVYIALGQFMLSAALLGVDACPLEGIITSKYDEILKLEGFETVVACAIGYRSANDWMASAKKIRFPKERLIESI